MYGASFPAPATSVVVTTNAITTSATSVVVSDDAINTSATSIVITGAEAQIAPATEIPPKVRFASDVAPAVDESFRTPPQVRSSTDDAALASDSVSRPSVLGRNPSDAIPAPQDATTAYIPRRFIRSGMDYAPVASDQVTTQFLSAAPKPAPRGDRASTKTSTPRTPSLVGTQGNYWASDVSISMPRPQELPVLLDLGGYAFTAGGITLNITESEVEEVFTAPFFAPEGELVGAI